MVAANVAPNRPMLLVAERMTRCLFLGCVAGLSAGMIAVGVESAPVRAEQGENKPPPPAAARWQSLDRSIADVRVAPDGRTWTQTFRLGNPPPDRADIRQFVERHFHDPQPQVSDAAFALFDDRGRAWFYDGPNSELLGYDGRRWIERAPQADDPFRGECPTRGAWNDGTTNLSVDGVCYFTSQFGIHRFDGARWSYHELGRGPPGVDYRVRVTASPDGRHVAAYRSPADGFRSYRDGRWQKHPEPTEVENDVRRFVVTNSGVVWYLTSTYELRRFSLDDPRSPAERLPALVADLAAANFDRREEATVELTRLAPQLRAELQQSLARATDPEARRRLLSVINSATRTAPDRSQSFFGCEVREPRSLHQDRHGRLIVSADQIDDARPGIVIVRPDGAPGERSVFVAERDLANSLRGLYGGQSPPLAAPTGDAVWYSTGGAARGALLLDLTQKKIVAEIDDPRLSDLRGLDAEGRPYVGRGGRNGSILVFDPRVADSGRPLRVVEPPLEVQAMRIASDGAIWVRHAENQYARFDGREWKPIDLPRSSEFHFATGAGGLVVVGGKGSSYSLYQGDRLVDRRRTLVGLIERHRDLVAESFRRSRTPTDPAYDGIGIVVDQAANIWIRHDNRISVLTTSGRLLTTRALARAGAEDSEWTLLTQAGDGGDVYVSNLQEPHRGGQSFLGRVEKGAVTFRNTFHAIDPALRDSNGAVWIGGLVTTFHDTYALIYGDRAVRLDVDAPEIDVKYCGRPFLVDRSDHVWLRRHWPRGDDRVGIWFDGRIRQEIRLPPTDEIRAAFSDRPGSVYLWIAGGLQHLIADPATGDYRLGTLYSVSGLPSNQTEFEYSPLGYFVVAGYTDLDRRKCFLTLIEIPKP